MKIEKGTKTVETFNVDGKEFDSKEKAEKYIEETKRKLGMEYYVVSVNPDLTEGRGYYDKIIIIAQKYTGINAVFQYLLNKYGNPISLVQGVSPMKTYVIQEALTFESKEDMELYFNTKHLVGVGDYTENKYLSAVFISNEGKLEGVAQ